MPIILDKFNYKIISSFVRLYSITRSNHYDVLRLKKNCTEKEIKDAFFKLSKEYHPDKNKSAKAQDQFVRIVEAYNVLSKPQSRAQYDSIIEIPIRPPPIYRHNVSQDYASQYTYDFSHTYASSKQRKVHDENSYYGVAGFKKMPNYAIIILCVGFATIGFLIQMFIIRESFSLHQRQAQQKSRRNAEELEKVRRAAAENGNEVQTRLLLDKIVTAANPTVATASLGQALAAEKKETSEMLLAEIDITNLKMCDAKMSRPDMIVTGFEVDGYVYRFTRYPDST